MPQLLQQQGIQDTQVTGNICQTYKQTQLENTIDSESPLLGKLMRSKFAV